MKYHLRSRPAANGIPCEATGLRVVLSLILLAAPKASQHHKPPNSNFSGRAQALRFAAPDGLRRSANSATNCFALPKVPKMNHRSCHSRRGLTFTEAVVAATLVVCMIGFVAPLTVRIGRVWQSTRQYRLAFNELANQMESLTSLGVSRCDAALVNLKPSASATKSLPDVWLEGQLLRDHDGTRLILSIDWDRGSQSVPISLVGWLDTVREGEAPAEPLRRKLGGSLALPIGVQP